MKIDVKMEVEKMRNEIEQSSFYNPKEDLENLEMHVNRKLGLLNIAANKKLLIGKFLVLHESEYHFFSVEDGNLSYSRDEDNTHDDYCSNVWFSKITDISIVKYNLFPKSSDRRVLVIKTESDHRDGDFEFSFNFSNINFNDKKGTIFIESFMLGGPDDRQCFIVDDLKKYRFLITEDIDVTNGDMLH